ncbi:MAG: glutamine synthetase family protein [Actinomycetota bacterium]
MDLEELTELVAVGEVDTVILAMTDMQGRLQGKRLDADAFLGDIAAHGAEACNYLLAVDMEMNTLPGFALTSWESGYGDFVLRPDLATLRRATWLEGTAICLADVEHHDGSPVVESPRQILRVQLDRLAARGWQAMVGSELEFVLYRETYASARDKGYRDLVPGNAYNVDYSILGTTMVEDVIRPIRLAMKAAGLTVEDSKGECNLGQHEVNFRYQDALRMADEHVLYKLAAKEIAHQRGAALSFMAKVNEREGNSCHIHCSLWAGDEPLFAGDGPHGHAPLYDQWIAGQLERTRELAYLYAPNVNSYKRYAHGSFAPTTLLWGRDNRTCAFRSVGHGPSLRLETRIAGGDANPYLAFAAVIAAGLDGVDRGLVPPAPLPGSAYDAEGPRLPTSLREAVDLLDGSALARAAFGDRVVDHYVTSGRHEVEAFEAAVTDWEMVRNFERS